MNEQKLLFSLQEDPWIEQLWRRVPLPTRAEIIMILAEMARAAVAKPARRRQQEVRDDR